MERKTFKVFVISGVFVVEEKKFRSKKAAEEFASTMQDSGFKVRIVD